LITQRIGILSRDLRIGENYSVAKEYLEQARQHALAIVPQNREDETLKARRLADALNGLGSVAILTGDLDMAQEFLSESDALFRKLGDLATRSSVVRHLAEIARLQQRFKDAHRLCSSAIQLARDADRKDRQADAFKEMALLEFAKNRRDRGLGWVEEARKMYEAIGAYSDAKRIELLTK
jgi:tetratricopeptide (TPR) repeat protein